MATATGTIERPLDGSHVGPLEEYDDQPTSINVALDGEPLTGDGAFGIQS